MDMRRFTHGKRSPQGEITRGKTAPNRLRRVDNFLLLYAPGLIRRQDGDFNGALYIDLGFGSDPGTTLESSVRLCRFNSALEVLGVEIDPGRVAAAQPFAAPGISFRLGGFNLPLYRQTGQRTERVRLIRAFNVLRQYHESQVQSTLQLLGSYLLPGGLLIEGTSNPAGSLWTANLFRQVATGELQWEAVVFSVNLKTGFEPALLQAVLPKNLIHRMQPGEKIHTFFEAWKNICRRLISRGSRAGSPLFPAAARELAQSGWPVLTGKRWLKRGYLVWLQ